MAGKRRHPALAVCCVQLAILLPVALVLLAVSKVVAYSALLGGVLFILPNTYFTAYAFRYSGANAPQRVAWAMYVGEAGKLVLTAVGFAVVLRLVQPLHVPTLIIAFCCLTASQWLIAREVAKRMTELNTDD